MKNSFETVDSSKGKDRQRQEVQITVKEPIE